MFINFIENRKALGYEVLRDTSCGIKLVLIVDSTVTRLLKPSKCKRQFVKKLSSKVNRKSERVIIVVTLVSTLWFSNVEPAPAMGLSTPAAPVVRIQPSYRHSSEVKIAPTVRPPLDKIVMMANNHNTHMIPLIYINGHSSYINEQLLKKLRAGDLSANLTIVAIGVVVFVMCQLSGADAFAIFDQIGKWNAPQPSPGFGLAPTSTSTSTQLSVIPTKAREFNDMSLKFNQPQAQYVMTKREALELIAKTYPGQMEVTDNERITDWQAAKHLYHAKGVGVDPEMYGITQKKLMEIGKPGGLTEYVRLGNTLPSIEHVKAYQEALKTICQNSPKRTDSKYYYKHGVTPATVYYDEDNRLIVSFNQTTGDLITGDTQRDNVFKRFVENNTLGGLQWIAKWANKSD